MKNLFLLSLCGAISVTSLAVLARANDVELASLSGGTQFILKREMTLPANEDRLYLHNGEIVSQPFDWYNQEFCAITFKPRVRWARVFKEGTPLTTTGRVIKNCSAIDEYSPNFDYSYTKLEIGSPSSVADIECKRNAVKSCPVITIDFFNTHAQGILEKQ